MNAHRELVYFAYGSNMLTARLRERLPQVETVGVGRLPGWRLRFDKRGAHDGSGKCHIARADDPCACVWGVLYRMSVAEHAALDRIEGVGQGYSVAWTPVEQVARGTSIDAFYYAADPAFVDAALVPCDWYRALVLAGAIEHRLPADYVAAIRAVPARADDDDARAARAWHLIETDPALAAQLSPATPR